jgi:hypothetical protein
VSTVRIIADSSARDVAGVVDRDVGDVVTAGTGGAVASAGTGGGTVPGDPPSDTFDAGVTADSGFGRRSATAGVVGAGGGAAGVGGGAIVSRRAVASLPVVVAGARSVSDGVVALGGACGRADVFGDDGDAGVRCALLAAGDCNGGFEAVVSRATGVLREGSGSGAAGGVDERLLVETGGGVGAGVDGAARSDGGVDTVVGVWVETAVGGGVGVGDSVTGGTAGGVAVAGTLSDSIGARVGSRDADRDSRGTASRSGVLDVPTGSAAGRLTSVKSSACSGRMR